MYNGLHVHYTSNLKVRFDFMKENKLENLIWIIFASIGAYLL